MFPINLTFCFVFFLLLLSFRHLRTKSIFSSAYRVLAILYVVLALWIMVSHLQLVMLQTGFSQRAPNLMPFHYVLLLSICPLLYFFFRLLSPPANACLWQSVWPHFILPVLVFVLALGVYVFLPHLMRMSVFDNDHFEHNLAAMLCRHGLCLQAVFYAVRIKRMQPGYYMFYKDEHAGEGMLKLKWLYWLMGVGALVLLVHECLCVQMLSTEIHLYVHLIAGYMVAMVFLANSVGTTGLVVFPYGRRQEKEELMSEEKKIVLADEEIKHIADCIDALMRKEKLYLNPDFDLPMLIAHSGLFRHQISETLNVVYPKGFSEMKHRYRIEYAKELIRNGELEHHTMESIAHKCGYTGLQVFSREFSKYCGICPGKYANSQRD